MKTFIINQTMEERNNQQIHFHCFNLFCIQSCRSYYNPSFPGITIRLGKNSTIYSNQKDKTNLIYCKQDRIKYGKQAIKGGGKKAGRHFCLSACVCRFSKVNTTYLHIIFFSLNDFVSVCMSLSPEKK